MKESLRKTLLAYVWITLASVIYAIGFNWCYEPNQIGFGGITGVAQIINAVLPWAPIGTVVILLNAPLFLLGWRLLGGHLLLSSLYAMFISSLAIDLLHMVYTFQPMDPVLATIYGGVLMGGSLGIVFLQGATTGGTDLIARLLKLKLAWLPMGRLVMAVDLLVIAASALAFQNLLSALYGLIALYVSSLVIDRVLYGMDSAKVAYIISDHPRRIVQAIGSHLERGVTILRGAGAWSGRDKEVLLCAFKQRQIVALKREVKRCDPAAFVIVCDAHEVLGLGFGSYREDGL